MKRAIQQYRVLAGLILLALTAWSQTDAGDGVARVSFLRGDVTIQRGDSGDLTEAALNAPLVTGDRILTGPGSRAEVQFDYGHFVRLAPNAELRMQELKPDRYLIAVATGTVSFSRVEDYDSDVELNTPSISVRPARKGNYRVSVLPDGTTEITVRDGQAEIYSPSGVQRLGKNQTMLVRGDASNPEFQTVAELRKDEFDEWNRDRDRLIRKSESYRYVDRSIPGAYDLDAYGGWVNVAPYGYVWRPRVAVGWAPYRAGRWAWVDYYGWNWVSYDPWGWAPYHYGRWFNSPGVGWCWWPGGRMRHYYSPAVVGFVGFNIGSVGVGIGFGNVGWVPLAPYEPFHRWWGGGWNNWYGGGWRNNRTYVDNSVNIVNNVNITNVYRNARVNNGVTVVSGESFRRGSSVNPIQVNAASLRSGSVVRGNLPVAPDRGSLQYSGRAVNRGQVESRLQQTEGRQFYSRTPISRGDRPNFETQRGAMEQVRQQTFGRGESANGATSRAGSGVRGEAASGGFGRGEAAGRGTVETGRGVATGRAADAGRGVDTGRAADTGRGSATVPQRGSAVAQEPATTDRGGWRRFGEPVNRDARGAATSGRGAAEATSSGNGATSRGGSAAENSGWRRFGEPVGRGQATSRSSEPGSTPSADRGSSSGAEARGSRGASDSGRTESNSGWRSFGRGSGSQDSGSSRQSGVTSSRGAESADRDSFSRGSSQRRSGDAYSRGSQSPSRGQDSSFGRGSSSSSQERVRVSPSIVRERGGGDSGSGRGASSGSDRSGGSSGGRSAEPSGGRGASSGRGGNNRSSVEGSNWRRFDGGAASGIEAYGEPATRSSGRSSAPSLRNSQDRDAFAGRGSTSSGGSWAGFGGSRNSGSRDAYRNSGSSSPSSRSYDSYGMGSRSRSSSEGYSAPRSSSRESSRGSYSAPSRSVYSGGSRSSAPSYSAPSRSGGSYGGSMGGSSRGASSSGSYSRGGGSISRGSMGGSSRSGGGSVSRGGGGRGGRN